MEMDGLLCLLLDTQGGSCVLVHHIADADRWYDFHEIGQDATVKSKEAFFLQDLLYHAAHWHLLRSFDRSYDKNKKKVILHNKRKRL